MTIVLTCIAREVLVKFFVDFMDNMEVAIRDALKMAGDKIEPVRCSNSSYLTNADLPSQTVIGICGGGSRIPYVKESLKRRFQPTPIISLPKDQIRW